MSEFSNTPNVVLQGNLEAFLDTPAQDLVVEAIIQAGFDPNTYDPQTLGHANYYGLPFSRTEESEGHRVGSPIYRRFFDLCKEERIRIEDVPSGSVRFRREPMRSTSSANFGKDLTQVTDRLAPTSMAALVDNETGETIAYITDTSSVARRGDVIIPTS